MAVRPDDLPAATTVNPATALIVDDGNSVRKATPLGVVDAAIPLASQAEAEAGTDNAKRVTPLRVKQAIDALGFSGADLASTEGAAMVGAKSPFTGTVARSLVDTVEESRSILEWFTETEKSAARSGDLSLDMTAAIQLAMDSGAPVIDMHDYSYRVDGTVNLPIAGVKITGKGWSAERGAGVVNNGGKMFSAVGCTGPIEIENGTLTGNVVRGGPGYDSFAAVIWTEDCTGGVTLRNMFASGGAAGCYVKYVDGFTVMGGEYTGNILGGISGFANNVLIDGARVHTNGYVSAGLTHDIYIINGTRGTIRNCYIGDNVDPVSDSLALRYDLTGAVAGFDNCSDWQVYNNTLSANGCRVSSDPGVAVADRKPPNEIYVFNNTFSGGAGLRFDDPQACKSWGNKGIGDLQVAVLSSYPGYVIGYISEGDECAAVRQNALTAKRFESATNVIFKNTVVSNGSSPAFNEIVGVGGLVACTIVEPRILGTGAPFDAAALARYSGAAPEVPVDAATSMRHLARAAYAETAIANGGTWNPDNHTATSRPFLVGRLNGATATIGTPTVAAEGMVLSLMLRATTATTPTFIADYKLSANTIAAISTPSAAGQYMILRFIYTISAWRQIGDASWTAA